VRFLAKGGYEADRTSEGREGLSLIERRPYDLILLDIKMPHGSGKEFYQTVRERFPEMCGRIVFVTGDIASRTTQTFIQETGNLCLKKPFSLEEIQEILDHFLGA
ncbi:MAG TPA: response regulator, partial [Nitrospiria bacterium]|nr:response regulator [Nitrospiria bacterium]